MMTGIKKGDRFKVTHFYADLQIGTEGTVVKSWADPDGNVWVRLFFGRNRSGQKLQKSIPLNCLTHDTSN